jgi:hypothetical protein
MDSEKPLVEAPKAVPNHHHHETAEGYQDIWLWAAACLGFEIRARVGSMVVEAVKLAVLPKMHTM